MKPYILNYSETVTLSSDIQILMHDVTRQTYTRETTDDDHSYEMSTVVTNTIENSDDNIALFNTSETRSLEQTDEDFIYFSNFDSTMITKVLEPTDQD